MPKQKSKPSFIIDVPSVRIVRPEKRNYQIRYTCSTEKREIRISVGSRDEEYAERLKIEIEAKLILGLATHPTETIEYGPAMEWEHFREAYRTMHLATLRNHSAADAEGRLDIAERIVHPKTLLDMAKSSTLQQLQTLLLSGANSKKKRRSPHTVKGYMRSIVVALNWAYHQDWLPSKPRLPKLKTSKNPMKGRPISEEEFQRMIDATEIVVGQQVAESWKYVLQGLWESALRIEELMHVSWDIPETIRPIWQDGKHPILEIPASMQKNDTFQTIPLLPGFENLLLRIPPAERTGWIFNPQSLQFKLGRSVRHKRPTTDWVGKVISRIGQQAGIVVVPGDEKREQATKYASAHDLRRSCGERLLNANIPPMLISRILRHSSFETTRKHYVAGDVQRAAETLRSMLDTPKGQ